jgi:hypothetical protein
MKEWSSFLSYKLQNQLITEEEYINYMQESFPSDCVPPTQVKPTKNLLKDLFALYCFFEKESPPEISVRRSNLRVILYGFGDASGSGSGHSTLEPSGVTCTYGVWGKDDEGASSNY